MKRLLSFALTLLALGCCNFAAARTFLVAVGVAEYADTTTTRIQANANDADSNGIITAKELFTYVYQGVLNDSGQIQHPVMWGRFPNDMPIITLR